MRPQETSRGPPGDLQESLKPLNYIVNMSHLEPFWCLGGSGALWGGFRGGPMWFWKDSGCFTPGGVDLLALWIPPGGADMKNQ